MSWSTADLCDAHVQSVQIADPIFRDYGGRQAFCGTITTVRAWEDNSLVRAALEEQGNGRVLVVDGGGSRRCAMLGDKLAALACGHGWHGVVIHGCVRDTAALHHMALGVRAVAACPVRSEKRNEGRRNVSLRMAGVIIKPDDFLYADADGIITCPHPLHKS